MTARNKNVPALRFKEFKEGWEFKKLSALTTKISDGLHSTPKYDDSGEYYFVNGNNLLNGKISFSDTTKRVNKEEYEKHKKDLSDKTILISINGTIGSLGLYNGEKIILGKSAGYLNLKTDVAKHFVYNILQSSKIINFFISELTGSTIKNLSLTTIKNCEVFIPSLPEQQKIASFLSAIDEKIRQLTHRKELLEQYKKGVMQQLFSGKLRFKNEKGKAYPKWEEKKLGSVLEIGSGRDYKHLGSGDIPVFGTGGYMLSVNEKLYSGETVFIGRKGTIDKPIYFNGDFWTVDTLFYTHKFIGVLPKFIYIIFQQVNWKLHNEASGVPSLSKATIEKIKVKIPILDEQIKIVDFIFSIDTKIESVSAQIERTKDYKKGLLQQMFV